MSPSPSSSPSARRRRRRRPTAVIVCFRFVSTEREIGPCGVSTGDLPSLATRRHVSTSPAVNGRPVSGMCLSSADGLAVFRGRMVQTDGRTARTDWRKELQERTYGNDRQKRTDEKRTDGQRARTDGRNGRTQGWTKGWKD